jgi:RNA polymerase primary sigma factor
METATQSREFNALTCYLTDITAYPLVDVEEERKLARRIRRGDEEALRKLVEANLSFVILIAKSYNHFGIPLEDLLNEGNLGLIEAAKRFDPERKLRFITYAVWWIRRSILQALTRDSRMVQIPKYKAKELQDFRRALQKLEFQLEREPTREEICEATRRSRTEVEDLLMLMPRELSLDAPSRVTEVPLSHYLPAGDGDELESTVARDQLRGQVRAAMSFLEEREQKVLRMRFGFGGPGLTLEQIGRRLRLTKERVRQIEIQARKRLRNILLARSDEFERMAIC